jgi:glutamate/tyrosine decarboxylase-like PLP-dependent enzyme
MGAGNFVGSLGDFLASVANSNLGGGDHAPALVEEQVVSWCAEASGLPAGCGGLLVTGASEANLIGLNVARFAKAGVDVRTEGIRADGELVYYASEQVHSCHQKSIELMGLGSRALRMIPVTAGYAIDVAALRQAIDEDRAAGRRPVCVIGTAGTVNTGAVDDLSALADLCAEQDLWFHVDGAIGGFLRISSQAGLVAGLERADSVALDLHKLLQSPISVGVALVRDRDLHRGAFTLVPPYLTHGTRGLAGGTVWFSDYGMALSRGFSGLRVWLAVKAFGMDAFGRVIDGNIALAEHLARAIESSADLELAAPPGLDIVCFRYRPERLSEVAADALNQEIVLRLQESGTAVTSQAVLGGRYSIRVALANHRTLPADLDLLVDSVRALGAQVLAEEPS